MLLCPLVGQEPELLCGEISNVAQNGERLRPRRERRRRLRFGEPTIEDVGERGREKHRGERRRERHTRNTPRVIRRGGRKNRTSFSERRRKMGAIHCPDLSPPPFYPRLPLQNASPRDCSLEGRVHRDCHTAGNTLRRLMSQVRVSDLPNTLQRFQLQS